ncbi:MAG: hypothetical protein GC158_07745 [Cyanobacteria bacterium RI_101]|nr:hypothetical protein [Cyanobacteria bacterium RI_101]
MLSTTLFPGPENEAPLAALIELESALGQTPPDLSQCQALLTRLQRVWEQYLERRGDSQLGLQTEIRRSLRLLQTEFQFWRLKVNSSPPEKLLRHCQILRRYYQASLEL